MKSNIVHRFIALSIVLTLVWSCNIYKDVYRPENKSVPTSYNGSNDTTNIVDINWRKYFADSNLIALIDTALKNNQELNIMRQMIKISKSEVRARKGEYLPQLGLKAGAGIEKSGRYTRNGAVEEELEIKPGKSFPEPLADFMLGAYATWEIDIWGKLRNAKKAANSEYLASIAGARFMVTNLIAEIAEAYYELIALDNLLLIIEKSIAIQSNALQVVKLQKQAARETQLAVNRFKAQLLNTQNLQFKIKQDITETKNKINFLIGRFPQPIQRSAAKYKNLTIDSIQAGIPSQLLRNRPDIIQAEYELSAAKLNVRSARASFYPTLDISTMIGFNAFNPTFLFNPQSLIYNVVGDIIAPLVNRSAIQSQYNAATARQIQAIFEYEQTILNAYVDVLNQLAKMNNYSQSYQIKKKEVNILNQSVSIAKNLFQSARADYLEVLLTQREALNSKMELVEIKLKQLQAKINIYRALGGGWN